MGATTLGNISQVLVSGNNIKSYIAGGTIYAGDVVAIHATGVDLTVYAAIAGTTAAVVGVALTSAVSGDRVAVAGPGCIVYVAEGDGGAGVDAGHWVIPSTRAGGVKEIADLENFEGVIGFTLDDLATNGTGRIMINPMPVET